MKTQCRARINLTVVLLWCLTASSAWPQSKVLKEEVISIEALAAKALQLFLNTGYKGNGKSISASGVSSYLTKYKISPSKLPADISGDISKGNVEAFLIPDVSNPVEPGTTGEVVMLRSKCLLGTEGCSHRGLLIQPPTFFGKSAEEEWCDNCRGCSGPQPPNCDIQRICTCTRRPCPGSECLPCTGC
ncbi:MAG: hypothetical protein L0387_04985 [Acidobacteria bacterium]|nr:hypothetical protein [Acidobacteriota bacterium]MCI0719040.1 hypothetical protein [Acidobacteriota bacterium]